jgi:SOS-response transcriptional repressor LexA
MATQGTTTPLGSRLKQARDAAGLTQHVLAEIVGIRQQAVQRIESGEAKTTSHIVPLAKALNVTPEWLALGEVPTSIPSVPTILMVHEEQKPYLIDRVFIAPILKWTDVSVVAKLPIKIDPLGHNWLAVSSPLHNKYFVLEIQDDTMSGEFLKGDYVIVDSTLKPCSGSIVIVAYKKAMLLCYYKKQKKQWILEPANGQLTTIPVDDNVVVLGVVTVRHTDFPRELE